LSNLIVFDLDGVITSEEAYWDAAGLTLHELFYSPRYWNIDRQQLGVDGCYHPAISAEESRRISRMLFPEAEIQALKARSINSNWDTCYATACLHLIDLLALLPALDPLLPLRPWDSDWLADFRMHRVSLTPVPNPRIPARGIPTMDERGALSALFEKLVFQGVVGLELINRFDVYASEVLGCEIRGVFTRYSPFWLFCRNIFQEWYLGDQLYREVYSHAPMQEGKPGCIHFEKPLLPSDIVRSTLETLRQQGYVLGFATGRTLREAIYPLKMYGLLTYFDEQHFSAYDSVEQAEIELRGVGDQTLLGKPNPFQLLVALDHRYLEKEARNQIPSHESFIVVGDSTSDILGGRAAGAITVAVLTGARTPEARTLLEQSQPDFTIADMTQLPALLTTIDSLATIQRLQFSDLAKAERLLRRWFDRHMHLSVERVTLMPKAVSLNSFNGFYHLDGQEYFFKTHIEEKGVLEEYYHAEMLSQAGYNIVKPLRTLHEEGRQMVIYPVVHWPVMFDLKRECTHLLAIYEETLSHSNANENARAPIHQLFWHRLAGERLKSFYEGKRVLLPGQRGKQKSQESISFEELLSCFWTIRGSLTNNTTPVQTLGELIECAKTVLNPAQEAMTVVGHGDAHFGNVFLETEGQETYLYFDPAFAGRHSPWLDVVKPLFHNVFATWMYFPREMARDLQLSVTKRGNHIDVEHNYVLTPLRQAMLETKRDCLLRPLKELMHLRSVLDEQWADTLRFALMCCPLLTVNLLDDQRMPPMITWLALSLAVEMGNLAGIGA
jgi:phosphoglycolate phosphatase-like HAD superfamily hydrolase